ncbi:MAG: Beta-monoglucosyldiacylglycerol synthase [Candidatus Latescibacteria bacterium ADurb.Bin168]|nr:MAG: Beta-monoglucosyldiacylglycerol synthase [Candidatus Latescibacteria bacterium ADurb.Bin168]
MLAISITAFVLALCYVVSAGILAGALRGNRRTRVPASAANAPVTVVIAARDEEEALSVCLESLIRQDYPPDMWNLVVVDDRSQDGTGEIVRRVRNENDRIHALRVDECDPTYGGKQNALAAGIEHMADTGILGDIILFTDADCVVPSSWITDMVAAFSSPRVGMVAGWTTIHTTPSIPSLLQKCELAYLLSVAFGMIALGRPVSAIGNNLAIRRKTYEEVGGYRSLGYTITEDCALVQRVAATSWRITTARDAAAVLTRPCASLGDFVRQRIRWAAGVRHLQVGQMLLPAFAFVHRLWIALTTATAWFGWLDWRIPAAVWCSSFLADAVLIGAPKNWKWAPMSPLLTLWQVGYQPVIAMMVLLSGRTRWRGSRYRL